MEWRGLAAPSYKPSHSDSAATGMLFKEILDGIAAGRVTLAFRRWRRPTVKAGGRLRTAIGELAIDRVDRIDAEQITDRDARLAGFASRAAALAALAGRDGTLYRIALRLAGADRRVALRQQVASAPEEWQQLIQRLARLDAASRGGPWTTATLQLIGSQPGVRAADLAARMGRERLDFKRDVRKLKELGLTESLEVGYRLSPRGGALLSRLPPATRASAEAPTVPVAIRRARAADTQRLTEIAHAAKRHWRYPEEWIRLWRRDLTVTAATIRDDLVYCAARGRRLVGFYSVSRDGDEFELEHLWVDPEHMGVGVGAALFRHAAERIRAAGGAVLRIASDPNAAGFYRRMGARRVGQVESTPPGRTLPLLRLNLR